MSVIFKAVREANTRHFVWLKGAIAPAGTLGPWRPRTRHRGSAVKWIGCLDNHLAHGIDKPPSYFTFEEGGGKWHKRHCRTWPMLSGIRSRL